MGPADRVRLLDVRDARCVDHRSLVMSLRLDDEIVLELDHVVHRIPRPKTAMQRMCEMCRHARRNCTVTLYCIFIHKEKRHASTCMTCGCMTSMRFTHAMCETHPIYNF